MKTIVLALCALLVVAGGATMALAQTDLSPQKSPSDTPAAAPTMTPPAAAPSAQDMAKAPEAKAPEAKVNIDVKTSDEGGSALPRTEMHRTGFFGLSPTAAIIVSVAVLLVVILAIVAMTHSGGTTYIDHTDRRV